MHVNIVTVYSGWILQIIANRIADYNTTKDVSMTVSNKADYNADVNYYVDIQNCYFGQKTNLDIGFFTHADKNSKEWLRELLIKQGGLALDGIVSMNKRYTDMLIDVGYDEERLTTIIPGQTHDKFPLKKTKIGIVSRGTPGQHYGGDFLKVFFTTYANELKGVQFVFLGQHWETLKELADELGIDMVCKSNEDYSTYPEFYQNIDYLLIQCEATAGPLSMQEALSTGVPIIGADVGFVNYEFSADYVFPPGDSDKLMKIITDIRRPIIERRAQVEHMTHEKYSNDLVEFFKYIEDL